MAQTLEELLIKITTNADDVQRQIDGATNRATKSTSKFGKVGAAVFGAWQRVGMKAVDAVFSAVSSNMGGAISRLDTLNNFTNVMTAIGFSAEEADASINGLADGIEKLPTTLDAVARQTQGIAAVTKDLSGAKDITLALNNALAAGGVAGGEAEGAIKQWTQAMAKGKPDYTEWMRFVQAAPAQMDQLAQSMLGAGATTGDLWAKIKDGSITIDELNKEMVDLAQNGNKELGFTSWAEQAEKASAGIQMSSINIKAAIQRNIANVLDAINDKLGDGGIAKAMESVVPVINSIGESLQKVISGEWSFDTLVSKMLDSIGRASREGVNEGSALIISIANGLTKSAPKLIEKAGIVIANFLRSLADKAPSLITAGFNLVQSIILGIIKALPSLVISGLQLITSIIEGIGSGETDLTGKITDIGIAIVKTLLQSLPAIAKAAVQLVKAVVDSWSNVNFLALGLRAFEKVKAGIIRVKPAIESAVSTLVRNVLTKLGFYGLKEKVNAAFESVKTAISNKLTSAYNTITGWIQKVKDLFPFNLGKLFNAEVPTFKANVTKNASGGAEMHVQGGRIPLAKAMNQPYLFTAPTEFLAGEAGDEMLYGRKSLMRDMKEAVKGSGGDTIINLNYDASDDANDMLRDLARGIQRYKMAGAI